MTLNKGTFLQTPDFMEYFTQIYADSSHCTAHSSSYTTNVSKDRSSVYDTPKIRDGDGAKLANK